MKLKLLQMLKKNSIQIFMCVPADVLLRNSNPLPMIGRADGPSIFNDK